MSKITLCVRCARFLSPQKSVLEVAHIRVIYTALQTGHGVPEDGEVHTCRMCVVPSGSGPSCLCKALPVTVCACRSCSHDGNTLQGLKIDPLHEQTSQTGHTRVPQVARPHVAHPEMTRAVEKRRSQRGRTPGSARNAGRGEPEEMAPFCQGSARRCSRPRCARATSHCRLPTVHRRCFRSYPEQLRLLQPCPLRLPAYTCSQARKRLRVRLISPVVVRLSTKPSRSSGTNTGIDGKGKQSLMAVSGLYVTVSSRAVTTLPVGRSACRSHTGQSGDEWERGG